MARSIALALVLSAALVAPPVDAQARNPRIAFLSPNSPEAVAEYVAAFRQGLRDHGYVEGTNVDVDYRFANRRFGDLPALARELVRLRPDVIVTQVTEASLAARDATKSIPIVIVGVGDPVAVGLVPNLARPGGNITGSSGMTIETAGKTVGLLKEAVPGMTRIGVLWNPLNATYQRQVLREVEAAARHLAIDVKLHSMADLDAIERSFEGMAKERVDGVVALSDPATGAFAGRIAELAIRSRLPSISSGPPFAEAGGMLAYGPDYSMLFREAADPVVRILRGAKPGDLAIVRPSRFVLVVNAKTARTIGVPIPAALTLRADRVIE
jgi:putative ABC transport system substrate-binding protein